MQFPPSASTSRAGQNVKTTQEHDFDYEATLAQTRALEAQLTEAGRAARVLKVSIRQEERDLAEERRELEVLRENFRRGGVAGRDMERRLHGVARSLGEGNEEVRVKIEEGEDVGEGMADQMLGTARRRRHMGAAEAGALLDARAIEEDQELKDLTGQLRSHLGSMVSNTAGLQGVRKELESAGAAVDAYAWRGMSRENYERVAGLR
jgi:phage shock protein A